MKRVLGLSAMVVFASCIDFNKKLEACRAGDSVCTPARDGGDITPASDGGDVGFIDGGSDGGASCVPACPTSQLCVAGKCLARTCSDAVCGPGQACIQNRCTTAPCVGVLCDARFTCVDGSCVSRSCGLIECAEGLACINGGCTDETCVGVVCDGGQCSNGRCHQPGPCSGKPVGTVCDDDKVCNQAGNCVLCVAGATCTANTKAPCFSGITACSTGALACIDDAQADAGTGCGVDKVCNAAGACADCVAGRPCSTPPNKCHDGVTSCSTGVSTCINGPAKAPGTSCGNGQVCDADGFCGVCTSNEACTTNPNKCFSGATDCTNGVRRCVDATMQPPGTSCGTNSYCDANGQCSMCTPGVVCTTNPGAPCLEGVTQCTTGHSMCADTTKALQKNYYRDSDGDGYGDPSAPQVVCGANPTAPNGYVANNKDCCDLDAKARPGQTDYFSSADGCNSFDYDCSNGPDFKYATGFTGCTFANTCLIDGHGYACSASGDPGWGTSVSSNAWKSATAIPACGEMGAYINKCGITNVALCTPNACDFDVTANQKQLCH